MGSGGPHPGGVADPGAGDDDTWTAEGLLQVRRPVVDPERLRLGQDTSGRLAGGRGEKRRQGGRENDEEPLLHAEKQRFAVVEQLSCSAVAAGKNPSNEAVCPDLHEEITSFG